MNAYPESTIFAKKDTVKSSIFNDLSIGLNYIFQINL